MQTRDQPNKVDQPRVVPEVKKLVMHHVRANTSQGSTDGSTTVGLGMQARMNEGLDRSLSRRIPFAAAGADQ